MGVGNMPFGDILQQFLIALQREGYDCPTKIELPRRVYERVCQEFIHRARYTNPRAAGVGHLAFAHANGSVDIVSNEPVPIQYYEISERDALYESIVSGPRLPGITRPISREQAEYLFPRD